MAFTLGSKDVIVIDDETSLDCMKNLDSGCEQVTSQVKSFGNGEISSLSSPQYSLGSVH